ncbi:MAG TPA: hypothetical protein VF209_02675 [Patescibacteria group bacterium]
MRRREKFVIAAALLGLGLFLVQFISLEYRYWAILLFSFVSYLISAWALAEDLQKFEWITILPFPTLYAGGVSLFYFLLPENIVSRFFILGLFGVGMYALLLTSNIYSVAKGKAIQLLHAAHAVGLFFTLLTSLLFTNTIYSLHLPFYLNGLLVGLVHFPLAYMSLWSVNLEQRVEKREVVLASLLNLFLIELAVIMSFFPISDWNRALFIMAILYLGLGVLHNFLRGVLFSNTLREYSLVAAFVGAVFLLLLPLK